MGALVRMESLSPIRFSRKRRGALLAKRSE